MLIFPFVQKQWFNLYLFNLNSISFHSILYYLSGIICPSLICFNSFSNYTYYVFNKNKSNRKKIIQGKTLFFLVVFNLIFLSYLITNYFYINFDFIIKLFIDDIKLQQPDIYLLGSLILIISILLNFKKFMFFLKKIILVNFILFSFFIWYLQVNNINVDDQFYIYRYLVLDNINLINVFILLTIEISYFIWSFLSYKTNLSDWMINLPQKREIIPILKILIFYFFIIIYYSILA